ncbi:MAG: hypothetical protein HY421_03005, partial [Candidatus Kerfeldbacteria bacterium]|nr:hypothetical protein [Candidatus Kerfeldbacteria bacterium]
IGVRSLLGVSLLLAGGLYLVAVLTSVVNQAPARVTCAPVTVIESESTADQVKNDTRSTKKLAQKFSQSKNAANRAALKQSAETRKRRLLTLFAGDPASARRQLLKPPERKKLEAVTSNCVETEVTVAGQLRVLHGEDFATHQPYEQFFITSGEKEYKLHGLTDVAAVEPGSTIQVEGFEIDGSILVAAPSPDTVQPTVQTTSQPPPALLNVPTPRKLLVLMGDYTNTDVRTPDYATVQTVLPKIADYYEENSYDLVTFEATSFDWFEMNLARGSTCDVYGVARELIRLVDPQVDFTQFNFADLAVIAPFPQFPSETNSPGCRWGGMSSVNPQTYTTADGNVRLTTVWIKAPTTAVDLEGVLDHELGHNIASYGHANHTWCVAGQTFYGPSCEQRDGNGNLVRGNFEYGDPYDIMGGWYYPTYRGYGIGHFNAARKAFAGWVRLEEIVTINSGDEGRTVTLVPLERDQSGTKLLKIQRTAYEYLTVQYRQPRLADGTLTYDDVFSSSFPAIFEGATVHTSAGSPTYLLDTTPNPDNDAADTVVRVGETFSDPLTGASIRVDSRTNDAITVTVTPPAIDFWPPASPVVVNDGPGADIDTTDDTTSLAANWEPVTDIGSGVDHYEYTVVWPSGELVPPTSSGLSASINLTGLNLQPGITYLVAVRAVDRYGNVGYYRFSDGLTVTTTRSPDPPLTVGSQPAAPDCVYDGPNFEDLEYSNQVQVLHAVWCESVDPVDYY